MRFPIVTAVLIASAAGANAERVKVVAVDHDLGEVLVGATVVVGAPELENAEITDENGTASFELRSGHYRVSVYYGESITYKDIELAPGDRVVVRVRVRNDTIVCFGWSPPPIIDPATTAACEPKLIRLPTALPRTLPLVGTDPSLEIRHRELRLGWADLLPIAFTDEVEKITNGALPHSSSRAGGAVLVLSESGNNKAELDVIAIAGNHHSEASAVASGPLVKDRVWLAGGAAPRSDRNGRVLPVFAKLDLAPSPESQGGALFASELREAGARSLAIGHWTLKFDNAKTEVDVRAGTSRDTIETPLVAAAAGGRRQTGSSRSGASAMLTRRSQALGNHEWRALIEGYVEGEAREASAAVSDSWQLLPHITLEGGLRFDHTPLGSNFSPRIGLVYDHTKESRARNFVGYGRYLDSFGRTEDIVHAGSEYEVIEDVAILGSLILRDGELGASAQFRTQRHDLRGVITYRYEPRALEPHRIDGALDYALAEICDADIAVGAIVREGGREGETRGSGAAVRVHRGGWAIGVEGTRVGGELGGAVSVQRIWE